MPGACFAAAQSCGAALQLVLGLGKWTSATNGVSSCYRFMCFGVEISAYCDSLVEFFASPNFLTCLFTYLATYLDVITCLPLWTLLWLVMIYPPQWLATGKWLLSSFCECTATFCQMLNQRYTISGQHFHSFQNNLISTALFLEMVVK